MVEIRYIYDFDNKPVNEYTIKNGKYQLSVINIGASITKIIVPNKYDKLENITLRYYDYKYYKKNEHLLGSLIDCHKFINKKEPGLNYYFLCEFENNSLVFTYKHKNDFIKVKYILEENYLLIKYDNNLGLQLGNILYLNLSGNLKSDVLNHMIFNGNNKIHLKEDNYYIVDDGDISIDCKQNGVSLNIVNKKPIYLSLCKKIDELFKVNKGIIVKTYSGIKVILVADNNCVRLNF